MVRFIRRSLQTYRSPLKPNPLVERSLGMQRMKQRAKGWLLWGFVSMAILYVLVSDIYNPCTYLEYKWQLAEYAATAFVGFVFFCCFCRYLHYLCKRPIRGTEAQKNLLSFRKNDGSFVVNSPLKETPKQQRKPHRTNTDILYWHSSFKDFTANGSPTWDAPQRSSPSRQNSSSQQQSLTENDMHNSSAYNSFNYSRAEAYHSSYLDYSDKESITTENELRKYLEAAAEKEEANYTEPEQWRIEHFGNHNSFWNYCTVAGNLLRTSLYQLAPSTSPSTPLKHAANETCVVNTIDCNSDIIKRTSSDKLSQYVANLRMWICCTILIRLVREIEKIDDGLKNRGFVDLEIGKIGLERLKKILENEQFVTMYMPMLPLLVPFLDMSSNQEYLVHRIKELSKTTCIVDYIWNSGSAYLGAKWDDHLPTDSAILFHLFCVYMDSQLLPLPQGGGRPFYSRYVLIADEKRTAKDTIAAVQNKARCAILVTNPSRPKLNFIADNQIHNSASGRNNVFYVIIEFLIYMRTHHESSLEGVNLGKSGINIMCVIED